MNGTARTGSAMSALEVIHETHYAYAAPVTQALHVAYLEPLSDTQQQLLAHELHIDPSPTRLTHETDAYGNRRVVFSLNQPHKALTVRSRSHVAPLSLADSCRPDLAPAWQAVAAALRYEAGARYDPAVEFVQPSAYVPRLAPLRDYGAASFPAGMPVAQGALDLMRRIHADFEFHNASTEIDTPLIEAFEQRSGVCQDFAHLMIGMLRMLGLPARYVSGYLLTKPPPGQPALQGTDASHAWVQLYSPDTPGVAGGWLDLDPTNNRVPGDSHVRLALGRDYGDVTPLRGVIRGGGEHRLRVSVTTRRIELP